MSFNVWKSLIDGTEIDVSAIPDSVRYHWETPIAGVSEGETVTNWPNEIGGEDITGNNDLIYREGSVDGRDAVESDGADDNGQATIPETGGDMDGGQAIGVTFKTTDTGDLLGARNDSQILSLGTEPTPNIDDGDGYLYVLWRDADGNNLEARSSTTVNDGTAYKALVQKNGNSANDIEIWLNETEETIGNTADQGVSTFNNWNRDMRFFAADDGSASTSIEDYISADVTRFTFYDSYQSDGNEPWF